jgi:hypothetical protein
MIKQFFLKSRHGDFCSSVSFWNKNGAGYGTDLSNLELFTREEAQRHLDQDIAALPLLASEVMKHSVLRVDMQYLDELRGKPTHASDECVIQIGKCFDGNDIKFKDDFFGTYDLENAVAIPFRVAINNRNQNNKVWLKSYLLSIARPTFQSKNIDVKTMVKGAGIQYKKPRKPRPTTGKTRSNCPDCGQIVWEYDPHVEHQCRKCLGVV